MAVEEVCDKTPSAVNDLPICPNREMLDEKLRKSIDEIMRLTFSSNNCGWIFKCKDNRFCYELCDEFCRELFGTTLLSNKEYNIVTRPISYHTLCANRSIIKDISYSSDKRPEYKNHHEIVDIVILQYIEDPYPFRIATLYFKYNYLAVDWYSIQKCDLRAYIMQAAYSVGMYIKI